MPLIILPDSTNQVKDNKVSFLQVINNNETFLRRKFRIKNHYYRN